MTIFEKATDFFKSIMNYFIGIMFILLKKDKHSLTVITILMISIALIQMLIFKVNKMKKKLRELEERTTQLENEVDKLKQ